MIMEKFLAEEIENAIRFGHQRTGSYELLGNKGELFLF